MIKRYPILFFSDSTSYVDWFSTRHDALIKRALACGLTEPGETIVLGWADRDELTGQTEYTRLGKRKVSP